MESVNPTPSPNLVTCCDNCECLDGSEAWVNSIKKEMNDFERNNQLNFPDSEISHVARVEIGNECDALREMVTCQQKIIKDLSLELEEERNASSSAANETMSMMLRLQNEKAEIQLEFRQFKRYAEEKMAHDQHQLSAMEDLVYNREMAIESLYAELHSYRLRMKSYGLVDFEVDGENTMPCLNSVDADFDVYGEMEALNYPLLRCNLNETFANVEVDNEVIDIDKYAFGDTPKVRNHLKDLEHRLNQLEKTPRPNLSDEEYPGLDNVWEKVIVSQSHHQPTHTMGISIDNPKSFVTIVEENSSDFESPRFVDSQKEELKKGFKFSGSEFGDDMSEKVCTIDIDDQDIISTPKGSFNLFDIEGHEIKELYMRLQALEADREVMRKALNAMQTDKAQVVLLKEIAQHLCKEIPQARRVPKKKPTLFRRFSFLSAFTLMVSFVFWRTKPRQPKYMFGISARNAGLRMFIDKGPRVGQWRCLFSTQI